MMRYPASTIVFRAFNLYSIVDSPDCAADRNVSPAQFVYPRFFRFWYVALRIVTGGSGLFLPLAQLSAAALRRLVDQVLDTRSYREWALAMMVAITNVNGLAMAAELIERVFGANHPITELRTTDR